MALAMLLVILVASLAPPRAAPAAVAGGLAPALPAIAPASAGGPQPLAATLSFALAASASQADPTDTVVFTVYFNNTGTQAAPAVWINVTAGSGWSFLGDTATGNVSGYPDYRFSALALGLHSFGMRFRVDVGTAPGTRLVVSATLVYSDGSGSQRFLGPSSASVLVGVVVKPLYLGWGSSTPGVLTPVAPTGSLSPLGTFTLNRGGPSVNFDLTPALARPFRALNGTAILYLQPLTSPASLDVNLTLVDVNGAATNAVAAVERTYSVTGSGYWTLYFTFPSMDYVFAAGHRIRLQVLNTLGSGYSVLLATNATAEPSSVGLQTTTYVSIDALAPALSPTTYLSPKSSLVITANVSDPFGSAEIIAAHVNVTGPGGSVVGWADAFPVAAVDPSSPSAWKLFRLTVNPPLRNGTYAVEVTAVERNGVTDLADGGATVRAPAFTLQKVASPDQGKSGTKLTYFLWYNNTGSGPAGRVWLNDTLPSQVNFANSSVSPTSVAGSAYSWVLTSVPVGSHVLQVFVQVRGGVSGVSYIRNWASLNFTDPQGFPWAPPPASHADVVLNGPFLALTQTSLPSASIHSNETVVYTITVTNTGDAAAMLWLNDTLPVGLTYVTDTALSAGGTRSLLGNQVHWTFPGMPSGASTPTQLSFTLTARAGAGLSGGASLPNVLALNDTSTNGVLMPDQVSLLALTVASPSIVSAVASFDAASAVPNVPLPLAVNFTNGGNEAAGATWINLTLDASLRFLSAGAPAVLSGSTLRITMANASLGANRVSVVLAAAPSVVDRQLLAISGTLRSTDGFGNLLPAVAVLPAIVAVSLPNVTFALGPDGGAAEAEAGTGVTYTVTGANTGTGTASAVWLNLTLPTGLDYVNDTFGAGRTVLGSTVSWVWRDYTPGTRAYALVLAAGHGAADNTTAILALSVQAADAGGNLRPPGAVEGQVRIHAPAFALSAWSDANQTVAGRTFTYTLVAENVGSTTAQTLWLTDTIDPHVNLLYFRSAVPATGTTTLNWTFADVAPGQRIEITVTVQVAEGTSGNTRVSNTLGAFYTNSAGVLLTYAASAQAMVVVQPDLLPLGLILGGGPAVGALVVFVVYRRYRVRIEDVFLIYRDGILVSHLSRGRGLDKDEDQLSGMLTAVQDFVKDAFTYGEHRELHQLEFGDYHVLIERGELVYLAVVYQGRDSGLIRKKVRTVLDRVESSYGEVFRAWDGDMGRVEGTRDLLRAGFAEDEHPWSLVKSKSP